MTRLSFFPTPYPDELFYSVLCRYHIRCGVPSTGITNRELSSFKIGQNVYLPQTIGRLSSMIPPEAGLTAEYFLKETTIFPYLKPFISEERCRHAIELLEDSEAKESAYQVMGFSRLETHKWRHLRYCEECWRNDLRIYGEAYWHRTHILPGVMVCPVHGTPIINSKILIANTGRQFSPASFELAASGRSEEQYSDETIEKLIALSKDSAWLLRHGHALPSLEDTLHKYEMLLSIRGFLNLNRTKTKSGELVNSINFFYGERFLDLLSIISDEPVPWSSRLFYRKSSLSSPLWHLLMIRFLAGSAEAFFTERRKELQPYGSGPWPCRNPTCGYYLKNTIAKIEVMYEQERFKAIFSCPYCGFTYRRSNGSYMDDQEQYPGRFQILNYGWQWKNMMTQLLKNGVPVMKIMALMHCAYKTVMTFGAENGFFTEDRVPKKYFYDRRRKNPEVNKPTPDLQMLYRDQWKAAVSSDPSSSRTSLMRRFPKAGKWLRKNDLEWYEANSPECRKSGSDWNAKDIQYLGRVADAIVSLLEISGKPVWITIRSVERHAGISNLYDYMRTGCIPLTKAYLDMNIENRTDWNKRKICWAVKTLYNLGRQPCLSSVRIIAGLTQETFDALREYTNNYVSQLLNADSI